MGSTVWKAQANYRTPVRFRASPMKVTSDLKTIVDLQADCRCIEFGKWLLTAVMIYPGLKMEEYLRKFKDEN